MKTQQNAVLSLHTSQGRRIAAYTVEKPNAFDLLNRLQRTHAQLQSVESVKITLTQNKTVLSTMLIPREKLGFIMHICSQRFGERSDALHRLTLVKI